MTLREYAEANIGKEVAECDREEYVEEWIKLHEEDALERGYNPYDPDYFPDS